MFCTCEIKAGTGVKKLDLGITKFPHNRVEKYQGDLQKSPLGD